jgi:hypothetical protein
MLAGKEVSTEDWANELHAAIEDYLTLLSDD